MYSIKLIKESFPKTYQGDFKIRLLEGREGVHSSDILPQAFWIPCRIKMPPKGHALYGIHMNK